MAREIWVIERMWDGGWAIYAKYKTKAGATRAIEALPRQRWNEFRVIRYVPKEAQ